MINFIRVLTFIIAVALLFFGFFHINPEEELEKAHRAFYAGDMDQTLRLAGRADFAFKDDKKKTEALFLQARAATKMNWDRKAKVYLDRLLSIDKENVRALLHRGKLEIQLGKNQDALRDLNKGLNTAPGNILAKVRAYYLSQRGLTYLALNQPVEAEKDAIEALSLATNLSEAHDLMSKVFEKKGEMKKALDECELAYKLAIEKDKLSFTTPKGRILSDRLVSLRGKYLLLK